MSKSARKIREASIKLFVYVAIIFLLLLTSINLNHYLTPKQVLGSETQNGSEEEFWRDFLSKNPNYIPGWIELGRYDKVKEIDPNYIIP